MKKIVLLTGSTGFVGSKILLMLRNSDVKVRLVVRTDSDVENIDRESIESIVTSLDIFAEDEEWWKSACKNIDTVVHVAWYADPKDYQYSSKNTECLKGTIALAKGAISAGVRRIVGIGTCAEYEESSLPLDIRSPLLPVTPYAVSKVETFLTLASLCSVSKVAFVWCRLFYIYGDGEHPARLYPYVVAKLVSGEMVNLSHGMQVRDFLDVEEVARQVVKVALGRRTGPINICSGQGITVRDFAEKIADKYGVREQLVFGERSANPFDPPFVVGVIT